MKLVRPERHSVALAGWLSQRSAATVLSSILIEVELIRATRRAVPEQLPRAVDVLAGIGVVTLSASVISRAAGYDDASLRSLDALHLATAQHIVSLTPGERLEAFVAYDLRLLASAHALGLPVASPGLG